MFNLRHVIVSLLIPERPEMVEVPGTRKCSDHVAGRLFPFHVTVGFSL